MGLTKYKLGELIELLTQTNSDLKYGIDDVRGVNNLKKLITTKADLNERDLSKFQVVYPGEFFFNHRTSRNGSKFSITYNYQKEPIICTEDYVVFRIKESNKRILINEWLYMFFSRPEFDRYVITNSWGSSTEFYNWDDICSIVLEVPDYEVQQKYVDIYNGLVENQKSYERGLDDLKLTCDAYIENLRKSTKIEPIGKYIEQIKDKNSDDIINEVYGVSNTLQFVTASSSVDKENLSNYKIVNKHDIAYVPTTHMKIWATAVSDKENPFVVSPIYEVFRVKDKNKLSPEYLFLWLCRNETIRYAFYNSWGSARENFNFEDMCNVSLPIPDIKLQESIVNIFEAYRIRKQINEDLKKQIKDICPILIKGSLEEGRKEA